VSTTTLPKIDVASTYDPFVLPYRDNPYPIYARARQESPVFFSEKFGLWLVTRYDDVSYVLKRPDLFYSEHNFDPVMPLPPEVLDILNEGFPNIFTLVTSDPPEHERLRGFLMAAFASEKTLKSRQQSHNLEIAYSLIDNFKADGQADLVSQYTALFPLMMMSEMTGLPQEGIKNILQACDNIANLLWGQNPLEKQLAFAHSIVDLQKYLTAQIDSRRAEPTHDILTDLIHARLHGEPECFLTTAEMVNLLTTMMFAIYENIPKGLANILMLLLKHPDQLEQLRDNPGLISSAIEEGIRVEPSVKGLIRTAKTDVELGGVVIPAEARLQIMLASANHDEAHFSNPERFDIHRKNLQKHLSFGSGIHRCIGIPLTKALGQIAIAALLDRLPNLRIPSEPGLEFEPNLIFRILKELPVEWDVSEA
jgi:cytochrome P450